MFLYYGNVNVYGNGKGNSNSDVNISGNSNSIGINVYNNKDPNHVHTNGKENDKHYVYRRFGPGLLSCAAHGPHTERPRDLHNAFPAPRIPAFQLIPGEQTSTWRA